jgi:hypothetical protein
LLVTKGNANCNRVLDATGGLDPATLRSMPSSQTVPVVSLQELCARLVKCVAALLNGRGSAHPAAKSEGTAARAQNWDAAHLKSSLHVLNEALKKRCR